MAIQDSDLFLVNRLGYPQTQANEGPIILVSDENVDLSAGTPSGTYFGNWANLFDADPSTSTYTGDKDGQWDNYTFDNPLPFTTLRILSVTSPPANQNWVVNNIDLGPGQNQGGTNNPEWEDLTARCQEKGITELRSLITGDAKAFLGYPPQATMLVFNLVEIDGQILDSSNPYTRLFLDPRADVTKFAIGEHVTEDGNGDDGTGTIYKINAADNTITFYGQEDHWDAGSNVKGPLKDDLSGTPTQTSHHVRADELEAKMRTNDLMLVNRVNNGEYASYQANKAAVFGGTTQAQAGPLIEVTTGTPTPGLIWSDYVTLGSSRLGFNEVPSGNDYAPNYKGTDGLISRAFTTDYQFLTYNSFAYILAAADPPQTDEGDFIMFTMTFDQKYPADSLEVQYAYHASHNYELNPPYAFLSDGNEDGPAQQMTWRSWSATEWPATTFDDVEPPSGLFDRLTVISRYGPNNHIGPYPPGGMFNGIWINGQKLVDGQPIITSMTRLVFDPGADLSVFKPGDKVTELGGDNTGTASVYAVDNVAKTMDVTSVTGNWEAGSDVVGREVTGPSAIQSTDHLLVNRNNASFHCTGADFNARYNP